MSKGMEDVLLSNGPLKNEKVDEFTILLNKKALSFCLRETEESQSFASFQKNSSLPLFEIRLLSISFQNHNFRDLTIYSSFKPLRKSYFCFNTGKLKIFVWSHISRAGNFISKYFFKKLYHFSCSSHRFLLLKCFGNVAVGSQGGNLFVSPKTFGSGVSVHVCQAKLQILFEHSFYSEI